MWLDFYPDPPVIMCSETALQEHKRFVFPIQIAVCHGQTIGRFGFAVSAGGKNIGNRSSAFGVLLIGRATLAESKSELAIGARLIL